jgi:hypothetical protein
LESPSTRCHGASSGVRVLEHVLDGLDVLLALLAVPQVLIGELPALQRILVSALEALQLLALEMCSQNLMMIMPSAASVPSNPEISS